MLSRLLSWKILVEVSDTNWTESSERHSVFFLVSLPFFFVVTPPYLKDPPSVHPPPFFFLSVLLFLCFVLLLSFSPSSFPLLAVVCRHAGISGPQNDRPNLSGLAPVTKDGCINQYVCTSQLGPVPLDATWLSTYIVGKAWISVFCLYEKFKIYDCFVTISLVCFAFCPAHSFVSSDTCIVHAAVFVSYFVHKWGRVFVRATCH